MPFVFVADVALFHWSFGSFSYIFVFKIESPEESNFMVVVKYIFVVSWLIQIHNSQTVGRVSRKAIDTIGSN